MQPDLVYGLVVFGLFLAILGAAGVGLLAGHVRRRR